MPKAPVRTVLELRSEHRLHIILRARELRALRRMTRKSGRTMAQEIRELILAAEAKR